MSAASPSLSDDFGYTQQFPNADYTDRIVCLPLDPISIHTLGKGVARSFVGNGVRLRLTNKYIYISKRTDLRVLQLGGSVHIDLEALNLCDPTFYLLREGGAAYQNAAIPLSLPVLVGAVQYAQVLEQLLEVNSLTFYIPSHAGVYAFKEALPLPHCLLDEAVGLTIRKYRNNKKLYSGKGTNGNGSAALFEELVFPLVVSNARLAEDFPASTKNGKMVATLRWHAPALAKRTIIRRDGQPSKGAMLQSDERFKQLRRVSSTRNHS